MWSSTARARATRHLSFYGAAAYTDGRYISFPDAPPPLEDTGGPQVKDISGSVLPGISKWAVSFGGEYTRTRDAARPHRRLLRRLDTSYRSSFSSSASASRYLVVDGYSLVNARVGFRWTDGWTLSLWSRNLLDRNYFELLTAAPGLFSRTGDFFVALDTSYRSAFSSSPSASRYLIVDGYSLVNARIGFRWTDGWTVSLWSRNLLDKDYYELLTAAPAIPVSTSVSPATAGRWA